MKKQIVKYVLSVFIILVIAGLSRFGGGIYEAFGHSHEHTMLINFFIIATLFVLSFLVFYISHLIKIPSFVVAIFLGLAGKSFLEPVASDSETLGVIVGFGATLILFSGGLEIPFSNFKKLIWKILSVSFLGLLITAFLYSWSVWLIGNVLGYEVSILTAVLLGAVLCSTDPAAIIPVLKRLRFYSRSVKDIIISESAVTDVAGTLLTVVFLAVAVAGSMNGNINEWYGALFGRESAIVLAKQMGFGAVLGVAGYYLLEMLVKVKHHYKQEFEADAAFFVAVPIIIFSISLFVGGSGYLAAFVAGLIFHVTKHLNDTERFFNNLVDGFLKPIIFILLGALVDLPKLIEYAPVGIVAALVFMFMIRPIAVFASLGMFKYFGKEKLSMRDLLFISFVRETGAIPAVLMLTIVAQGLDGVNGLVEIGMWAILMTLIIEPIFTPMVAKKLKVAELIQNEKATELSDKTAVVLVTRGRSYAKRIPQVIEWAKCHKVEEIIVLLCLEDKFSTELEGKIENEVKAIFDKAQEEIEKNALPVIDFRFVSKKGLLSDNIEEIAKMDHKISTIFAGKKMLDYYLSEIKEFKIPFYFMD